MVTAGATGATGVGADTAGAGTTATGTGPARGWGSGVTAGASGAGGAELRCARVSTASAAGEDNWSGATTALSTVAWIGLGAFVGVSTAASGAGRRDSAIDVVSVPVSRTRTSVPTVTAKAAANPTSPASSFALNVAPIAQNNNGAI